MAKCTKIYRKSSRVCIGSLNRRIIIYTRRIISPTDNNVDFAEEFLEPKTVWAMIDTVGETIFFDDTNTDRAITHNIYIRYYKGITPEKCAQKILNAISKGKEETLIGGPEILTVYLRRFFPALFSKIIRNHPIKKLNQIRINFFLGK